MPLPINPSIPAPDREQAKRAAGACAGVMGLLCLSFLLRQLTITREHAREFVRTASVLQGVSCAYFIALAAGVLEFRSRDDQTFPLFIADYYCIYTFIIGRYLVHSKAATEPSRKLYAFAWGVLLANLAANAVRRALDTFWLVIVLQGTTLFVLTLIFAYMLWTTWRVQTRITLALAIGFPFLILCMFAVMLFVRLKLDSVEGMLLELLWAVCCGVSLPMLTESSDRTDEWMTQAIQQQRARAADRQALINFMSHEARGPVNCVLLGVQELQQRVQHELEHQARQKAAQAHVPAQQKATGPRATDFPTVVQASTGTAPSNSAAPDHTDAVHHLRSSSSSSSSSTSSSTSSPSWGPKATPGQSNADVWLSASTMAVLQETLDSSVQACHILRSIFDSTLEHAKQDAKRLQLSIGTIELRSFLEPTLLTFRMALQAQQVQLETDYHLLLPPPGAAGSPAAAAQGTTPSPTPSLSTLHDRSHGSSREGAAGYQAVARGFGDEAKLVSVVRNLLSNASKYSPAGSAVKVRVSLRRPELAEFLIASTLEKTFGASCTLCSEEPAMAAPRRWSQRKVLPEQATSSIGSQHNRGGLKGAAQPNGMVTWPPQTLRQAVLLQVDVIDHGRGLTAEEQASAFGMFSTVEGGASERTQAQGSTGLGLHFAQAIAREHGGNLTVQSAGRNKGCTFTLTAMLGYAHTASNEACSMPDTASSPLACSPATQAPVEELPGSGSTVPNCMSSSSIGDTDTLGGPQLAVSSVASTSPPRIPSISRAHVLVADDSASMRKVLLRVLKPHVARLSTATDGSAAFDSVVQAARSAHPVHAVVMDRYMDPIGGLQAALQLRAAGWQGCILGLTGAAEEDELAEFRAAGATRVLQKPVDAATILAALGDCLGGSE